MDTKQNTKEMMDWFDKHKAELLNGKGFVKKRRASMPMKERKKEKAWVSKSAIHYGEERNTTATKVKEYHIHGHTQILWSDGNITCDCNGWVFKREGKPRECRHVRELYGKLTGKATPEKQAKDPMIEIGKGVEGIIKSLRALVE